MILPEQPRSAGSRNGYGHSRMAARPRCQDHWAVLLPDATASAGISMTLDTKSLEQIRTRLLARRAELQQRTNRVGQDLSRQLEPLSYDADDRAIQLENDESLQAIGQAAVRELADIDVALDRMARGLYGICKICGHEISTPRLAAVPQASTCQRCG